VYHHTPYNDLRRDPAIVRDTTLEDLRIELIEAKRLLATFRDHSKLLRDYLRDDDEWVDSDYDDFVLSLDDTESRAAKLEDKLHDSNQQIITLPTATRWHKLTELGVGR
jgi:hypothetical protein